jgi:hypothetical protein
MWYAKVRLPRKMLADWRSLKRLGLEDPGLEANPATVRKICQKHCPGVAILRVYWKPTNG